MRSQSSPPSTKTLLAWHHFAEAAMDGVHTTVFTAETARGTLHRVTQIGADNIAAIAVDLVPLQEPAAGNTLYMQSFPLPGIDDPSRTQALIDALRAADRAVALILQGQQAAPAPAARATPKQHVRAA